MSLIVEGYLFSKKLFGSKHYCIDKYNNIEVNNIAQSLLDNAVKYIIFSLLKV